MSTENKTPGLRIVAGTEGPAEGPESNAAKIAAVQARSRNFDGKPRKVRSDAGIPKKRGRRGPYHEPIAPSAGEIDNLHSQAFRDLGGGICDCTRMANIAAQIVQNQGGLDGELVFAVVHVYEMLRAFKANYYAAWHEAESGEA
jgi:hypothetical protein